MWMIVPFIAGLFIGGLVVAFWDEIKEWAENLLEYVIDEINKVLEVISDAFVYIVQEGTRFYKRFEVYTKNIRTNKIESHIEIKEVSESEIPDEVKQQLQMRSDNKIQIMQREA